MSRISVFLGAVLYAALLFLSCTKEAPSPASVAVPIKEKQHSWLYFVPQDDGSFYIKSSAAVDDIPSVTFVPWTEAVRTAGVSIHKQQPVFMINKYGLVAGTAVRENAKLPLLHDLFSRTTAGDWYNLSGEYFVRVYQNSFFTPENRLNNDIFLLKTDKALRFYTPAAKSTSLHLSADAQCTACTYVDGYWYLSFKEDNGTDVSFSYFRCKDLYSLTGTDAHRSADIISAETFRDTCEPRPYYEMLPLLKDLADVIDCPVPLYIAVSTEDASYSSLFIKQPHAVPEKQQIPLDAKALFYTRDKGMHTAAILMPDGTLYLNTSEHGIQTFNLPPLPEGFVYSYFFMTGSAIIAAWEEIAFYEVGRTGFFTAALSELSVQ